MLLPALTHALALLGLVLALYGALLRTEPPPSPVPAPRRQRLPCDPTLTKLAALTVAHSPRRQGRVTPTYLALRRAFAAEARVQALVAMA